MLASRTFSWSRPRERGPILPEHCYNRVSMYGYILSAAAIASASAAAYQSMAPSGQWYGRTFTRLPRPSKRLALTYDDGPNDPYTLRLMEVLAKHDVRDILYHWA